MVISCWFLGCLSAAEVEGGEGGFAVDGKAAMSTEEVFDSAVDAALDVIGGSGDFGVSDEVEEVCDAVAE